MVLLSRRDAAACQKTTCANSDSAACVRDPASLCWAAGAPVGFWQGCLSFSILGQGIPRFGLDYAATEALVSAAFDRWTKVSCGTYTPTISVVPMGPIACNDVEYNPTGPNANSVLFRESDWVHEPGALGLTSVAFDSLTGKILDADMEINLAAPGATLEALPYILTHEVGHFLGLDHSADPNALMYAQYTPVGRASPEPTTDDVTAICRAYPPRTTVECNFAPELGFDASCGGDVRGGCAFRPAPSEHGHWLFGALGAFGVIRWLRHGRRLARVGTRNAQKW